MYSPRAGTVMKLWNPFQTFFCVALSFVGTDLQLGHSTSYAVLLCAFSFIFRIYSEPEKVNGVMILYR
jgi:threonine/homoserine/homoserine lactone efflux protein